MSLNDAKPVDTTAGCASKGPAVPLSFLKEGDSGIVERISGKEDVRKFLAGLGFIQGASVKVVSLNGAGLILDVKGSRVAVDDKMAAKIVVSQ